MNYSIHFRPEVEKDLLIGYFWYEEKNRGLGEEFLQLFYLQVEEIRNNPLLYKKVHKENRRSLLKSFPYAVYYQIENEKIIVFGLFHCARNPNYLHDLLANRTK
jgi:mRNA-degrading endonuclease RelE of RelBE toxin-antitoxin system